MQPGGQRAALRRLQGIQPHAHRRTAGRLAGGLILLNLMPCVFPVLAIKVVGFTRHAQDRRAHRISGLAYTAGVVLVFSWRWVRPHAGPAGCGRGRGLGLSAAVARRGGGAGGLFTLIGLNLAGVFEFETCCRRPWPACRRATRWPTAS